MREEIPITPGEIESCPDCMSFVRKQIARNQSPPKWATIHGIHMILHRAPWEPFEGMPHGRKKGRM